MCDTKCGGGMCILAKVAKLLLIVGGVNWGLVGVGMFLGINLNLVNLLLGGMPMIEAVVYVLVGVSAVANAIGCICRKCSMACGSGTCCTESKTGESMM